MLSYKGNKLYFGKFSVASLAKKFGTPIYVYDLDLIQRNVERHLQAFQGEVDIHYAMKANSNPAVLGVVKKTGVGIDAVSGGEIKWALKQKFSPGQIIYSGVGKSVDEIELSVSRKIKMINVESPGELIRIAQVAKRLKKVAQVGIRFNPDVSVDTHPYITTGFRENKFGMDRSFLPQIKEILTKNKKHLNLVGVSLHIGSQLKDLAPLKEAIDKTKPVYNELRSFGLKYFDVGGGVAINYREDSELPQTLEEYGTLVQSQLSSFDCRVLCEPGRVIVGDAGILVASVEYIKKTPYKNFAIINSGMNHLLRPALYQAYHEVLKAEISSDLIEYDIVGPICESSDFLAKSRKLPSLSEGDVLVLADAGAYGFSMASFYNLHSLPQEITLKGSSAKVSKSVASFRV